MYPRNPELRQLSRARYSGEDLAQIRELLIKRGTLSFPALPNGLYSAASVSQHAAHTGYQAVWVRDNVYVAYSLLANGEAGKAAATVLALADHFQRQAGRFNAIIADPSQAANPVNRPHVKFNGYPIGEIDTWPHDQNDALGYFLWIFCRMARLDLIPLSQSHAAVIAHFPLYFRAIRFWSDEDSGHWEEARKNSASSIGAVCAGLRELNALLDSGQGSRLHNGVSRELVESLLESGMNRLNQILPAECIQDPPRARRYDAALLFLAWPLEIVDQEMADRIVQDVRLNLQGDYGIRRYLGDSFWCSNYLTNLRAEDRTRDFSMDLSSRDRFFEPGTEAQWCIFDPIVSVVFGQRYLNTGDAPWLLLQTEHFNRALNQITADLRCPELWHWETGPDGGAVLETSEATPLLWTEANLWLALSQMESSAKHAERSARG
jgi:phosphorylase kinase alpha/beta subunit